MKDEPSQNKQNASGQMQNKKLPFSEKIMAAMTILVVLFWIGGLLLLSGCVSVSDYHPYVVEINDAELFVTDASVCRDDAINYSSSLSIGTLGNAAAGGALDNAADAAVAPILLAAGAAGKFTKEGLNEIGLNDENKIRIFLHCLDKKSDDIKPRPYLVLDPKLWS